MAKNKTCAEIFQVLKILHPEPCVVELRALHTRKGTRSGYFDDMKKLASEAVSLKDEPGIYVTLNPCNPALLSRSLNHLSDYAKQTTKDAEILDRRWLPVDLDPVRPTGIPSTDQEHEAAMSFELPVGEKSSTPMKQSFPPKQRISSALGVKIHEPGKCRASISEP